MTASVDAQMRCVACVDALRDRGWAQYPHIIGVYPGGDEVPGGNGIADRDLDVIAAWFPVALPSMTASVDAQMRCVACVDALRDRGSAQYPHTIWVYPGGGNA